MPFADETGLILALVVNALLLACAGRFARRRNADVVSTVIDTLLIFFLVQYASVGAAGIVGLLQPWIVILLACAVSVALQRFSNVSLGFARNHAGPCGSGFSPDTKNPDPQGPAWLRDKRFQELASKKTDWMFRASFLFLIGFVGAMIWLQRLLPPMANDALTYHLPAAVKWLQEGKISILQTWFYNPANTYSPLAGSVWCAWWMMFTHDDVLARFVQVWPWLGLFAGVTALARALIAARWNGAEDQPRAIAVACLTGLALVLARPFLSQVTLPKDDLYTAFFFVCAVVGLSRKRAGEPLAPWRVGVSVGLLIATKYTALMSLPVLLLMIDAPWRAGWRWKKWGVVVGCVLLLAGPWYARNAFLFGNPLYPQRVTILGHEILPGLIELSRSTQLFTRAGVAHALVGDYYSVPKVVAALIAAGWMICAFIMGTRAGREPVVRIVVIGSTLGLALFIARSPYAEIRFVYPSLLLLFAGAGCAGLSFSPKLGVTWAVLLAGTCMVTGFNTTGSRDVAEVVRNFFLAGVVLAGAGELLMRLQWKWRATIVSLVVVIVGMTFTLARQWPGYIQTYRAAQTEAWETQYGSIARAWQAVSAAVPADATLAYTNTYLLHPLYGPTLQRKLVYVPVRPGVKTLADVPPLRESVGGEQLIPHVVRTTTDHADETVWLANLRASGATHLLICAGQTSMLLQDDPIELEWTHARPEIFKPIASVAKTAVILEIHWVVW